ncbi:MAG: diguanylate cyclase [Tatlockia sp.]|nr:diguanylate cyclase [Tatlockia sp.]
MINLMKGKKREPKTAFSNFFSRMQLNRSTLNLIFIPALILLLLLNIYSFKQVRALIEANRWVIHTYEVIQTTDSSLYGLVDIESRQRGYLLRGAHYFLDDIDLTKANLKEDLNRLNNLTRDNLEQNNRVIRFIKLIDKRLDLLNQLMKLKASNQINPEIYNSLLDQSYNSSSRVKDLGQEIKSVEMTLLSERNVLALKQAKTSSMILVVGSILSVIFLITAFVLANIELFNRKRTELQSIDMQRQLREIIESTSDMIAAYDKEWHLIVFNEAYQREFKRLFDKSITINMTLEEVFKGLPEDRKAIMLAWRESLRGSENTKKFEFSLDKQKNIYEMTTNPIQHDNKEMIGVVHNVRNITRRVQEHIDLQDSYKKLALGMQELQSKNEQIIILVEMSDLMLASSSLNELAEVLAKYSQRLLPLTSGHLFIMHPSKNYLEKASSWGEPHSAVSTFTPDQCWAIRLGRLHRTSYEKNGLICAHIHDDHKLDSVYLCIPLMAQNDIYGLIYIEILEKHATIIDPNQNLLVTAFAELTALALANVRLRENLRHQSIRDPLTGLYNRRYLEEYLFKLLHQAERKKVPFAVLMLDLDFFKSINDTYGHDAGDMVLKELGELFISEIRLGDIAARYGGEEFIIIFYDIDLTNAKKQAESLRSAISKLHIKYGAQQVSSISMSIGLAMYPDDATTSQVLIESADKALYYAKNNGRNQVAVFSTLR